MMLKSHDRLEDIQHGLDLAYEYLMTVSETYNVEIEVDEPATAECSPQLADTIAQFTSEVVRAVLAREATRVKELIYKPAKLTAE